MNKVFTIFLCFSVVSFLWAASSNNQNQMTLIPSSHPDQIWGPDLYGYIAKDSNEPGGPPVNWIDISAIGTVVTGLGDDNIVGPFNMGFPFRYYWYDVPSFHIGSNGYLRFSGAGQLSSPFMPIPNPTPPNDVVCFYTADFDPSSGGTVYYWSNNTDTLIVSFEGVPAWNTPVSTGSFTFQVILSMVDTSLTFNYATLTTSAFYNANGYVGIENNAGDIGIQCYATNVLPSNYAIKFYYPPSTTFQVHDVGVTQVQNDNSGGFFVETNNNLMASGVIKNQGNQHEGDFYVMAEVRTFPTNTLIHIDSIFVDTLEAGQEMQLDFSETWTMNTAGDYYLRIISDLPGDLVPSNDQKDVEMHVVDLPGELSLDDGTSEQSWSWAGGNGGMGVYYIPPAYPVKVTEIKAFMEGGTGLPALLEIYDDDGPNGEPGTQLSSTSVNVPGPNWYTVDVSAQDIIINDGGVYVAWMMTGDGSPGIGIDNNSIGSRQTWEYTGVWATFRNNETDDAMLRLSVEPFGQVVFADDFESYTPGMQLTTQNSTDWSTWSGVPGSAEDPYVTDVAAFSGSNSILIQDTAGSPNDLVKPIADYTEGKYRISFLMYIPAGFDGYFNTLQHFAGAASQWGMQAYFYAGGQGNVDAGAPLVAPFTYAHDTWLLNEVVVDLNLDSAWYYLEGNMIVDWIWSTGPFGTGTLNQLGGSNFYGHNDPSTPEPAKYYFDDYSLVRIDSGVVSIDDNAFTTLPLQYSLEQNYPNPFNPVTTIPYVLPERSKVKIEIYNVLGENVVTIVDNTQMAGNHEVHWKPESRASGIYFYRMYAKGAVSGKIYNNVRKLILLK